SSTNAGYHSKRVAKDAWALNGKRGVSPETAILLAVEPSSSGDESKPGLGAPCHSASLRYFGAMKLDKFTVKAQEALQEAQAIARKRDHQEILPEHLLAALLQQQDGLVPPLLQRVGVEPRLVQQRLEDELG